MGIYKSETKKDNKRKKKVVLTSMDGKRTKKLFFWQGKFSCKGLKHVRKQQLYEV